MHSNLNISNLISNNLSTEGFIIPPLKEEDTVYLKNKFIIDELVSEFKELKSGMSMEDFSIAKIQRYINFTTKSDFPIGIIIVALIKIGIPFKVENSSDLIFQISKEAFDKCFVRHVRSEIICDCKSELDNSYF